jgi:hypothetical protein
MEKRVADYKSQVEFAEICGIHAGDGWMSSSTNEVGYGTSPKEEAYFQEVLSLYKNHFDMKYLRILKRLAVEFRFQSKTAQSLLIEAGFVRGKKLDKLQVPPFVLEDYERVKAFLRGLVDTDGNVYWRHSVNHFYLVISWTTTSETLAKNILSMLSDLKYRPTHYSFMIKSGHRRRAYKICLMRTVDVKKYLEEIGFRNRTRWLQVSGKPEELSRYSLTTELLEKIENVGPPRFELGTSTL